jgi:type IV secretory pathway VirB10-like protein
MIAGRRSERASQLRADGRAAVSALLVSAIDGAVQATVQSSSRGSGAIIYNPSAAQDVTTEVLKSTLSIPPTVRKENGDRIQILVARDIDFTSVYELRHAPRQP